MNRKKIRRRINIMADLISMNIMNLLLVSKEEDRPEINKNNFRTMMTMMIIS
jgi:hypothetical protein